jgi:hypothetical protein
VKPSRLKNIPTKRARLKDLPLYSPWPKRLLGIDPWQPRLKTQDEIFREYDREKWGPLLEYLTQHPSCGLSEVIRYELGEDRELIISEGKCLRLMGIYEARQRYLDIVSSIVAHYLPASALVEFGAGAGGMVLSIALSPWANGMNFIAADCCPNAVSLAQLLAEREGINVQAGTCDLRKSPVTSLAIPPGAVIFTSYAASCIPMLDKDFIEAICLLKPKAVVHFEPCYEHCLHDDILNLMRRRYIEVNGYNLNLVTILDEAAASGAIRIRSSKRALYGINPFFSASCLIWTPCKTFSHN